MSGFWGASNKIPVKQTSTAISSANGLSYQEGQVIHIDIPPSVKFIQPKESWLQFDFKISNPVNASDGVSRLQLDGQIGGQSLIRDIRIYSSTENGGVLLEEIQNYNSMVSVKYDYNTDDNLKNKRSIAGEGCTIHNPKTRGSLGTPKSMVADVFNNPYFQAPPSGNQNSAFTNSSFTTAKLMLPLHTGIWSSDKVFPNLLTGCRIEITLESADRCLRLLESAIPTNRAGLNPVFDSVNGSGNAGGNTKTGLAQGDKMTKFYITKENNQTTPEACPFVCGECVSFVPANGSLTQGSVFQATSGNGVPAPRIASINASGNASGGDGLIEIVLDQEYELTSANNVVVGQSFVYSASIDDALFDQNPTYTISNVEMIVQELDMGQSYENSMRKAMSEGGMIGYDILTATNYKFSQLSSDIVANIRLPLNESRARSIVCVPTDATSYTTKQRLVCGNTYDIQGANDGYITSNSTRSGLVGISDFLTDYRFFYDGKLQPSRKVSTAKISSKTSIDAQPLIETEKALVQAGIPCRSFENFNANFVVARALGLNQSVYDTRGKDFNLQLNYQGTAPTKNKLWNNFVFALRRINIRGDSISVVA